MKKRINVMLSDETIRLIDRVSRRGNRGEVIDEAMQHYVSTLGEAELAERIRRGARKRAARDLELAAEWFPVEEEAWSSGRRQ
jgi:CopG family transcriptional regulator/antitoxin EndoAI